MEATKQLGMYSPKWKLTIEFPHHQEQRFWDPRKLLNLLQKIVEEYPWIGKLGNSLNETLEISTPVLHPVVHPDCGPETEIVFEHKELLLSQTQLWAYEEWARRVSGKLGEEIVHVLRSISLSNNVIWEVNMTHSTPLRRESTESYRLTSKPGDVVRMACGTLAVVTDFQILMGGHVKELTLRPICGIFRHFRLLFSFKRGLYPAQEQIDNLTKIGEFPIVR